MQDGMSSFFEMSKDYRMAHLLEDLDWVDSDLRSSKAGGPLLHTAAIYCPSRVMEHPKSGYSSHLKAHMAKHLEPRFKCSA